jgi:HlyD family secretion protein
MNDTTTPHDAHGETLQQLLDVHTPRRFGRRRLLLGAGLLLAAVILLGLLRQGGEAATTSYTTEAASVGTLVVKVSATGNLEPTNKVDVGSELSGIVDQVYVDDNDRVRKGQVLARLDTAKLRDAVVKSRASLTAAEAQVKQAEATTAEARAALARYRQVAQLSGGKVPSRNEMDIAEATLKRAEAVEASARASVAQARASLQSDETNLAKATIRSPINGVVLSRSVEPGQTVAASLQAPTLFTLAEDLTKMELQVQVDEADVGQVTTGQRADFSVDAWPGRRYEAGVSRVNYGSQKESNVISYLTTLTVENGDLSLRPGMTGTAEITTLTREKALLVPNAALRFTPPAAPAAPKKGGTSVIGALMPRPPRQEPKAQAAATTGASKVWVLRDGQPVAVEVQTGASNGRQTEIIGGALREGMQVITESVEKKS